MSDERRTLVNKRLRERLALRGSWRAVGVSFGGLLPGMVACCAACPDHGHLRLPANAAQGLLYTLEAAADDMWSCGHQQANTQWS